MTTGTPGGQFMDMDTKAVSSLAAQLSELVTSFQTELTSFLDEADSIESRIGQGPMGREFVRGIRQPLYDTKKFAQRLGVLGEERSRALKISHDHYVSAEDASGQAFGSA